MGKLGTEKENRKNLNLEEVTTTNIYWAATVFQPVKKVKWYRRCFHGTSCPVGKKYSRKYVITNVHLPWKKCIGAMDGRGTYLA